ncbi:28S ribosomal protein S18b, mitochondrial [Aricia agestis]|uniref:28S ribosomal protein S18b, mitochondrial n=1 Tax=Aricia agestis TaxID=91739 RepID=UPI001C20265A|nr:28S ribosomal protein S18b, mitochondrial [Aricia agestis]
MALTIYSRNYLKTIFQRVLTSKSTNTCFYSDTAEDGDETQETPIDPSKDRTKVIPVETSIRYLQSKAYKQTYGDKPVWFLYRRNHKGAFAPRKTRRTCVRNGIISTGNPCPICRDEYLVLDPRNTGLLEQFISEYTGQILDSFKTGLCQKKHKDLLVAIEKAWDEGNLTYDVPFRVYDYSVYNKSHEQSQ